MDKTGTDSAITIDSKSAYELTPIKTENQASKRIYISILIEKMSKHLSDEDDDITPVFAFRADNIMQKQREAYEEMLKKVEEENSAKAMENEECELLVKIHEKLKRKPRGKRKAGPTKQRENDLNADIKQRKTSKKEDQSPINLPARVKKKLLKVDLENTRARKRIEALNKRVLTSCVSAAVDDQDTSMDVETEQNITLKISYLSDVSKIIVSQNEKFSSIISKITDFFKLKVTEVTLCLRDNIIGLDDTPSSLQVKAWDIIDCIPCKSSGGVPEDSDSNKILIKMQSSDSRKKIDIYAHKLERFQDIMKRYAILRSLPLQDLIFEFDGEKISDSDTPDDLDMESGSCVDVKVVGDSLKSIPPSIQFVDLEKEEHQHEMLNICVLD